MGRALLLSILLLTVSCVPASVSVKEKPEVKPKEETVSPKVTAVKKGSYRPKPGALFYYMVYLNEKSKGNYTAAYRAIKEAVERAPKRVEYLLEAAKMAVDLRKLKEAEGFIQKVLSIEPNNLQALKLKKLGFLHVMSFIYL